MQFSFLGCMYIYNGELDIESSWDISDTIGPYPISKGTGKMANQTDRQSDRSRHAEADNGPSLYKSCIQNLILRCGGISMRRPLHSPLPPVLLHSLCPITRSNCLMCIIGPHRCAVSSELF